MPSFAHVSNALYKASKIKVVVLMPDLSAKFKELKALMLSAFAVRLPDVDREFIMEKNGSKVTVRAVLKQQFDDI